MNGRNSYTGSQERAFPSEFIQLLEAVTVAQSAAQPIDQSGGDMDARIPASIWRKLVDAHAAALYARAHPSALRAEWLSNYFRGLRFDPSHHLGCGDIRLTIGQQDEIVEAMKRSAPDVTHATSGPR